MQIEPKVLYKIRVNCNIKFSGFLPKHNLIPEIGIKLTGEIQESNYIDHLFSILSFFKISGGGLGF